MRDSGQVDIIALGPLGARLDSGARGLEAKGSGVPPTPDAGIHTGAVALMLTSFCESLGEIVAALDISVEGTRWSKQMWADSEEASRLKATQPDPDCMPKD